MTIFLNGSNVSETVSFGEPVEQISFEFNETSNSKGCAFNFYDENSNRVSTAGTDNPQWSLLDLDGGGSRFYEGNGYNRWIEVKAEFYPDIGEIQVRYDDQQSGTTKYATGDLRTDSYPVEVQFASASNEYFWPKSGKFTDTELRNVTSSPAPTLEAPSNVSASASGNDVSLSWNSATGANGYNILRAPSSGGSYSQIASVGSGTTSFVDSGLAYSENYAYKIEAYN